MWSGDVNIPIAFFVASSTGVRYDNVSLDRRPAEGHE